MERTLDTSGRAGLYAFSGLSLVYLVTRIYNLLTLPIFNDEAIYLRMAQLARAGHWWVTFDYENRKPLYVWLVALCRPLAADPLIVARGLTVLFGWATLALIFMFAYRLSGWRGAALAGALYLLSPFTSFHDRLGLYDTPAMLLSAGSLLYAWRMVTEQRLSHAWLFGLFTGLGLINKEVAYFSLAFPLAIAVGLWWGREKIAVSSFITRYAAGVGLALAILLGVISWPLHKYSAGFMHSAGYYLPVREIAALPWGLWWRNLNWVGASYGVYLGLPLLLAALAHFVWGIVRRRPLAVGLGLIWLGPSLVFIIISNRYYSRYLLFLLPAIFLAVTDLVRQFESWLRPRFSKQATAAALILALIILGWPLKLWSQIVFDPIRAELWPPDREQYVEGWASGYGGREIIDRLEAEAARGPITVFVAPFAGLYKDLLLVYLEGRPNIDVRVAAWFRERPLLFFAGQPQQFYYQQETFLRDAPRRLLDPASIKRALYVINVPQTRLIDFYRFNPQAALVYHVYKPGNKSLAAILEVPLP